MIKSELHGEIKNTAIEYKKQEAKLMHLLQKVEECRLFLDYGYSSLFGYVIEELGLSEEQAYSFIRVSRKARVIPELKKAIEGQELTISKAIRIVSVLESKQNSENNKEWILKAMHLPKRELEKQVAMVSPKAATQERVKYVQEQRLDLRLGISEAIHSKLRRVQDLESQKKGKPASFEDVLESVLNLYLSKFDPLQKTPRQKPDKIVQNGVPKAQTSESKRVTIATSSKNKLHLSAGSQCMHIHENKRCEEKRWLDIHHKIPVSQGGTNDFENLILLCRAHHKYVHKVGFNQQALPLK